MSSGVCAVSADFVTGATNGTWSISWSDPCPHRIAGARPPSTSIGEPFWWAPAIALIPLVTPGPALGGERRGLLVAHVENPDAVLAAAVVDREEVPAREREEVLDAQRLQHR